MYGAAEHDTRAKEETDGTARVEGDPSVLAELGAIMVEFDPRFPIMPGTALPQSAYPVHNPYEADPRKPIAE